MSLKEINPTVLTFEQYNDLEICKCGKSFFKYHDTSKNHYVSKCSNVKEEFNIKIRKWILSKKQPCGEFYVYYGERPVFAEIQKNIPETLKIHYDGNTLEKRLRSLFSFLFVSNRTSTLNEIDLIVKYELNREPRKIFYSPTTTVWMKEICRETFEDYQTRIFSKKIIEIKIKPVTIFNLKPPIQPKITQSSQFIITSDSETEEEVGADIEVGNEDNLDSETEIELDIEDLDARGDSDIEDLEEETESIYEEEVEAYEENEESYDYDGDD